MTYWHCNSCDADFFYPDTDMYGELICPHCSAEEIFDYDEVDET